MAQPVDVFFMYANLEGNLLISSAESLIKHMALDITDYSSFMRYLLRHGKYPPTDSVFLIPPRPLVYGSGNTFWNRVRQSLPPVVHYGGQWKVWEDGPIPDQVRDAAGQDISVFIVPEHQYSLLNKERDQLTELRRINISQRAQKSPSTGASASTFRKDQSSKPIRFGRPKTDDFYPIPIGLLHPEFAAFQDDLRFAPLEPSLTPLGWKWATELSELFEKKVDREEKLHMLLRELFGKDMHLEKHKSDGDITDGRIVHPEYISLPAMPTNIEVKNETTEGSCDGLFKLMLHFYEGVRAVLEMNQYKGHWRKTRLPSVLILHNGPNIQVFGAVCLTDPLVEVLSPSIPLYFNQCNTLAMEILLRLMVALRNLQHSIINVYQKPLLHSVNADQVEFPYPRSYRVGIHQKVSDVTGAEIGFTYVERISNIRLVFRARTEDHQPIIVKFGFGHYGWEAHVDAAKMRLAPNLISFSQLSGGAWMAVMEVLPQGFRPCDELGSISGPCAVAINAAVSQLHNLGYVHGDLRDTNVFVDDGKSEKVTCMLIDYDWSGREGTVKYPLGVFSNIDVWRPEKYLDGKDITVDHDLKTVKQFLLVKTPLRRV